MKLHYRFITILIRFLARILFGCRITGVENVPVTGALIAANHISVIDPPLLGASIKADVFYFAKVELFQNRLISAFLKSVNAFPARRGETDRKAWKTARSLLTSGKLLLFFPEGTRSADGQLQPAKPGMARLALGTGVPVVPAVITGSNRLKEVLLRRVKLRVGFAAPVSVADLRDDENRRSRCERLTAKVMEEIRRLKAEVEKN